MHRNPLFCVIALTAAAATAAHAGTVHVPGDAPTLQDALNIAGPGDEIVLAAGQYDASDGFTFPSDGVAIRGATGDAADVVFIGAEAIAPFTMTDRAGMVLADLSILECNTAVRLVFSELRIDNCVFMLNEKRTTGPGGTITAIGSSLVIDASRFEDNLATPVSVTGAVAVFGGTLEVTRSTFIDNIGEGNPTSPSTAGGAIGAGVVLDNGQSVGATVTVTDSVFINNDADLGAAIAGIDASITIDRCRFLGNNATLGGAVFIRDAANITTATPASMTVTNSAFSGNQARRANGLNGIGGAAASFEGATLALINTTLWANTAEALASGAYTTTAGGLTVYNSILAGPTPQALSAPGGPITASNLAASSADSAGLVNPSGADGTPGTADDDLRLAPGSPAIDAGNNALLPAGIALDLAALPRFADDPATPDTGPGPAPIIDIGAHEFQPTTPCNPADLAPPFGQLTFADISTFLAAFASQSPAADLAAPLGNYTFADITAFLSAFSAGCP